MHKRRKSAPEKSRSTCAESDAKNLVITYLQMELALERCVWDLGLATYREHDGLKDKLKETLTAPHKVLLGLATYYINRLDSQKPEHAIGIYTLGGVVRFAGELAACYDPKAGDDDTEHGEDGSSAATVQ